MEKETGFPASVNPPGYVPDPLGVWEACTQVTQAWMRHPEALQRQQLAVYAQWQQVLDDLQKASASQATGAGSDAGSPEWTWFHHPYWSILQQSHELLIQLAEQHAAHAPGVDEKTREKAIFWLKQVLQAFSPAHYFWTNPQAIQKAIQTGGKSLMQGWQLWTEDCKRQDISMVDPAPFRVGENLGTTPGRVVYRNALMEVLQYAPETERVHQIPILFVPPWINKFYILDMDQKKSLIRYLVKQGFTVFLISWRNPDASLRHIGFSDYVQQGILQAVEVVQHIAGTKALHAVGYCIGGTALSATMAYIQQDKAWKKNPPISSWTLLCSLQNFENPGEIQVFIDEKTIAFIEQLMKPVGYLDGKIMANTFRMLRSHNLIWEYVISQYLMGEKPSAFDILYWNTDSTRLPEKMHSEYLRKLYLENRLIEKGGLQIGGVGIDLQQITAPLYAVGTEQDHITPWKETFKVRGNVQGPVRYVLAASGHIVGVLSPPVNPPKRHYWAADVPAGTPCDNPDSWLASVTKQPGSWWEDWLQWLQDKTGPLGAPPSMGSARYPAQEKAPGSYVLEKC